MSEKNINQEKNYWNKFYSQFKYLIPSQFCSLMASELEENSIVVEYGCGNGRDSLFLAKNGHRIYAIDLSEEVIKANILGSQHLENIKFYQGDVSNEKDVTSPIKKAHQDSKQNPIIIYSRFFLHTLDSEQEKKFITALSNILKPNDLLYFEFRSKGDEIQNKIYGNHFRRYIDENIFFKDLEKHYGFSILYKITGQGMAKFKLEDPVVSRVIAVKI